MKILVAEDDYYSRTNLVSFIRELGYDVSGASNGLEAIEAIEREEYGIVFSDIKMPGLDGIELLKKVKNSRKGYFTEVVLFTGFSEVDTAISALHWGAFDYLAKPVSLKEIKKIIEKVTAYQDFLNEQRGILKHRIADQSLPENNRQRLKTQLAKHVSGGEFYTGSEGLKSIVDYAYRLHFNRNIPVLIEGETGTGKELIARLIHFGPLEDTRPFVDINCAAITTSLFESELFGYEPGAFTGGLTKGQKGKLDAAQSGTLFLDEIGDLAPELQGKLLRVLQEKEFYRVGGTTKTQSDIRLICATNRNLTKAVETGNFRGDLFFRLNVGYIFLPPLRERKEDIIPLAQKFITEFSVRTKRDIPSLSSEAQAVLKGYHWPGNVRELRNLIEYTLFMFRTDKILAEHLTKIPNLPPKELLPQMNLPEENLSDKAFSLDRHIQDIIADVMKKYDGNKTEVAKYLGISRTTLYTHLKHMTGK
ncbi:MAG: sigma-54 dependent transcriptional regulator [Negativicutes bacterium]|nr:sigma-54 dependent transcriptional regulator [Negativicutes bacterium]